MSETDKLLPPGATRSDGPTKPSKEMGGFKVTFTIPYTMDSVIKELLEPTNPLGASSEKLTFETVRAGWDGKSSVSRGYVRRVTFDEPFSGSTVSELVTLEELSNGWFLKWRQLQSTTRLNLIGDGDEFPEFSITLVNNSGDSTTATLDYNFKKVSLSGPLCCFACIMPKLLEWHLTKTIHLVWANEMASRGYQQTEKGKFTAVSQDKELEEAIKARAKAASENLSLRDKIVKCLNLPQ